MKRVAFLGFLVASFTLAAGTAMADDITGRLGVTGRIGFLVPADSEDVAGAGIRNIDTDVGFVGGGGFIFGINKNIAAELEITHTEFNGDEPDGDRYGDFETTNLSLGVQYRFNDPVPHLTPYVGGGVDILINDLTTAAGAGRDVDTVAGVHLNAGVDYFVLKQLALTTELKGVLAPNADITNPANGTKIGNFDPSSFSMTFGARLFFN